MGRSTPLPLSDEGTGSVVEVLSTFSDKVFILEFSALRAPVVVVYWSWIDLHIVPTAFSGFCRTAVISVMALRVRSLASPTAGGVELRVVRVHGMERSVRSILSTSISFPSGLVKMIFSPIDSAIAPELSTTAEKRQVKLSL